MNPALSPQPPLAPAPWTGELRSSPGEGEASWDAEHMPRVHCHGDVLAGRYRLLEPLAEGGMGSVWRACNLGLDVEVAIKVVKRSVSSPKACERLLREARAAASLGHPSIVRVLDFGTTDDGEPFLVMQLLHGRTLGAWLRERGRIPAARAVELLLPLVSALAEVHGLGIVHRDIKPENILFEETSSGHLVPKLVDFGIAKQTGADQSYFTQSGVLMGSPAYMSPEQARGEPRIDARSDIWSLCVVLYEMITGLRPFEGINHGAILFAVFADAPEPTHAQGAGDEALWEILRRGLAKSAADRWQSMRQLGHALASWAAANGVTADATGASLTHHWLDVEAFHAFDLGPPAVESARSRHVRPPDQTGQVHTISSPASSPSPDEPALELPMGGQPLIRGPVLGLGGVLVVLTGIVTFLILTFGIPGVIKPGRPSFHAAGQKAEAVAAPLLAASVVEPLAIPPAEPAPVVVPALAPLVVPSAGTAARPANRAVPPRSPVRPGVIRPRPLAEKSPMPLPTRPDF